MVFGSSLQRLLFRYFPMLDRFVSCLISLRTFLALALLTLFFVALYTWLPYERQDIRLQLPGALISTVGWIGCSYGFSIYFNYFGNYSYMYGSLAAIALSIFVGFISVCAYCLWERNLTGSGMRYK